MKRRALLGYMATGAFAGMFGARAYASDGLVPSGPIRVTRSGTVLEGLDIRADRTAIHLERVGQVTIRNCRILHNAEGGKREACGILANKVDGLTIEGCEIVNIGAPTRGPLPSSRQWNILVTQSRDLTMKSVTVRRGSTGAYLQNVHNSHVEGFESHDMRGPFPRGAALQWAGCTGRHVAVDLSDESIPGTSNNEDSFNVFDTPNLSMSRVVVPIMSDSPTGRGLVVEHQRSVDCHIDQAELGWLFNGSFSLNGSRLRVSGARTRGWNRYSVRGFPGSSLGGKNPPAMIAFGGIIRALEVDHQYWDAAPSNLVYNPEGNRGIRNRAIDWSPRLSVVRNRFPWRSSNRVPDPDLPVRIGSWWQPNPNTGEPGVYGNRLVPGSVLAVLPGRYWYDPTDLEWQWYRDSRPIAGATGMNYVVTPADMGSEIVVTELARNRAGASPLTVSEPVYC